MKELEVENNDTNFSNPIEVEMKEPGLNGLSAYEVAVKDGFIGTEEEWLESLKGEDGTNGENGLSAYQIAVNNGFTGNETEWLESLKGEDGANGQNGINGTDGTNGENGLSAYEVAVKDGFIGTEEEWLESLKGETGPEGPVAEVDYEEIDRHIDTKITESVMPILDMSDKVYSGSFIKKTDLQTFIPFFQKIIDNTPNKGLEINDSNRCAIKYRYENAGSSGAYIFTLSSISYFNKEIESSTVKLCFTYFLPSTYNNTSTVLELINCIINAKLNVGKITELTGISSQNESEIIMMSRGYGYIPRKYNTQNGTRHGALTTDNTNKYTPTGIYHPATKGYVDDITGSLENLETQDKSSLVSAINEVSNNSGTEQYAFTYNEKLTQEVFDKYKTIIDIWTTKKVISDAIMKFYEDSVKLSNFGAVSSTSNGSKIYKLVFTGTDYNTSNDWAGLLVIIVSFTLSVDGTLEGSSIKYSYNSYVQLSTFMGQNKKDYKGLSLTNTYSYTPTGDYNPATKKYVDDTINSKVEKVYNWDGTDTEENRAMFSEIIKKIKTGNYNIKLFLNLGYNNPSFTYDYDEINGFSTRLSLDGLNDKRFLASFLILQLNHNSYECLKVNRYTTIFKYTLDENENITFTSFPRPTFKSVTGYDYRIPRIYKKDDMYGNYSGVITTDNQEEYTPTGNYHPATKKYVDDQVGNINTILATLTTPTVTEEVTQ